MIDAGETQQKSYLGFMMRTPDGFGEVSDVTLTDGRISIKENGGKRLDIETTLSL
jgi:hypothetical protein